MIPVPVPRNFVGTVALKILCQMININSFESFLNFFALIAHVYYFIEKEFLRNIKKNRNLNNIKYSHASDSYINKF